MDEKFVSKFTELCDEISRISKENKDLKVTYEKMLATLHEQRVQLTELSRTNNQSNTVLNEFQKKVVALTALQKKDMQDLTSKYNKEILSLKQTITEKMQTTKTAVPVTLPNIVIPSVKRKPVKKANPRKPPNKKKSKARSIGKPIGKTVTAKRNPTLSKLASRKK